MALQNLGVDTRHVFACDIDAHAKQTILANHKPEVFFDDLCKRDNATAPKSDLYVAGFPCQPFSAAGLTQGFGDLRGRGQILFEICDYLENQRPRCFVLENVKGIINHEGGTTFKTVMEALRKIGKGAYTVSWDKLNTKLHGVPHNRERVYFVGILIRHASAPFEFPEPLETCPSIEQILDPRTRRPTSEDLPPASQTTYRRNVNVALQELRAKGHDPLAEPWVVEIDCTTPRLQYVLGTSPCITVRRGSGHWITNRGRRMTKAEMMRLQGMDLGKFTQVVSDNALGRQIGNTMSVNVLERLFVRLLPAAGLCAASELIDRWEVAARRGLCAVRPSALRSVASALRVADDAAKVSAKVAKAKVSAKVAKSAAAKAAKTTSQKRATRAATAAADRRRLGSAVQERYRAGREGMLKARRAAPALKRKRAGLV